MSELVIKTNGHTRDVLYWYDLTDAEREDLSGYDGVEESEFFRFKGNVYDMNEFMSLHNSFYSPNPCKFKGWDGYLSDSFFSGVLVRYARNEWGDVDTDYVVVGWYYC